MGLTNAYRDFVANATTGVGGPTLFNNANAHVGVGDSETAFAVTQTDLQAVTNKERAPMESGFPTATDNVMEFRCVFGEAAANFAWFEWGIFNAASGGVMMNREVEEESLGTKEGGTWTLTVTMTLSVS